MNKIKLLVNDIRDLRKKLLNKAVEEVKPEIVADGSNVAKAKHRIELRQIKNLLKEKLAIYDLIERAEGVRREYRG